MDEWLKQRQVRKLTTRMGRVETKASGIPVGTSFPSSAADDMIFYRTDLNWLCFYDAGNTQWLTTQEWPVVVTYSTDLTATYAATTNAVRRGQPRSSHAPFFTRAQVYTGLAAGTSNGANFWTVTLVAVDNATTVWSFTTAADPAAANTPHSTNAVTAQPAAAENLIRMDLTRTGAPPNLSILGAILFYRLVIP